MAVINPSRFQRALIESLHVEALLLADEARGYFDGSSSGQSGLSPLQRIMLTCEALRVTTRLMHVMAWVMTRRAVEKGEISEAEAAAPSRRLGADHAPDAGALAQLPAEAQDIITASRELYERTARLDAGLARRAPRPADVQQLHERLAAAF